MVSYPFSLMSCDFHAFQPFVSEKGCGAPVLSFVFPCFSNDFDFAFDVILRTSCVFRTFRLFVSEWGYRPVRPYALFCSRLAFRAHSARS